MSTSEKQVVREQSVIRIPSRREWRRIIAALENCIERFEASVPHHTPEESEIFWRMGLAHEALCLGWKGNPDPLNELAEFEAWQCVAEYHRKRYPRKAGTRPPADEQKKFRAALWRLLLAE